MPIRIPTLELGCSRVGIGIVPFAEPPGEKVWHDAEGRIVAFGQRSSHEDLLTVPRLGLFRWTETADVITAHPEPGVSPDAIEETFERGVLPLALQARGIQVLHASGIETPQGVVAFCARSQTGKSTLAYACSRAWGFPLWADDAVAFAPGSEGAMAISLPFSLKLRKRSVEHFGVESAERLQALPRGEPGRPYELIALFTLRRSSSERTAEVSPLSAADAFAALLEHAYCFDLEDRRRRQRTIDHYLDLSASVPAFELRFRPGFGALAEVLEQLRSAVPATAVPDTIAMGS